MTAFVRRYSQRIAALICTLRGHQWGNWKTISGAAAPGIAPYGMRKCKRCGKVQVGAAPAKRKRRAATSADTIQGKP